MTTPAIVAVASSAGGVGALGELVGKLPADLPVPVVVVQHLDPGHRSLLTEILGRRGPLPVRHPVEGEALQPGTVTVAVPNRHLLVSEGGIVSLTDTGTVHFVRPSADLLFTSVAESYGPAALVVVLTGTGTDGADGVRAVVAQGGTVIVEDPETAQFPGMPQAAIDAQANARVLCLADIPSAVVALVTGDTDG